MGFDLFASVCTSASMSTENVLRDSAARSIGIADMTCPIAS